ncbi:MAG: hypothetical protein OXU81_15510 [Gammaproteobacteria bacterium]|nr:hypothetical protein [Gammaproteobacteria bacterium]
MNILTPELVAILSVGIALAALLFSAIRRIDTYRTEASADRRAFQSTADADRRAFQASMDEFRREMRRLAERQSRLEGIQEAQAAGTAAGS